MPIYHPLAELAPRDVVARSIFTEIHREGSSHVFLDLSKIEPSLIKSRFPNIYDTCLKYGLDISTQPIPVAPAAHYIMGGVMTDLWGRTAIPGLYAAGEVAATGVHGANRLASNSLLEGLVFGGRIVDYLKTQPLHPPSETNNLHIWYPEARLEYRDWPSSLATLHQITDHYLGIIRDEQGLQTAVQLLTPEYPAKIGFELNPAFFELQSMYNLTALIAGAAQMRTESRGGHFRSDYPTPDQNWRKHIHFHNNEIEVAE
jgi:L-aspartate oxidase